MAEKSGTLRALLDLSEPQRCQRGMGLRPRFNISLGKPCEGDVTQNMCRITDTGRYWCAILMNPRTHFAQLECADRGLLRSKGP